MPIIFVSAKLLKLEKAYKSDDKNCFLKSSRLNICSHCMLSAEVTEYHLTKTENLRYDQSY